MGKTLTPKACLLPQTLEGTALFATDLGFIRPKVLGRIALRSVAKFCDVIRHTCSLVHSPAGELEPGLIELEPGRYHEKQWQQTRHKMHVLFHIILRRITGVIRRKTTVPPSNLRPGKHPPPKLPIV